MTVALRGLSAAPELAIRAGETVLIIGRPGTGKTTLAGRLLESAGSAIVYETKGDPLEQSDWEAAGFQRVTHPDDLRLHARAMLTVPAAWLEDRKRWTDPGHPWSAALDHPFRRRPTALLFDEVLNVFPSRGGHPGTARLLQQGRSFGITSIILSQLANNIDTRLLRLAQHIVVMGPAPGGKDLDYLRQETQTNIKPLRTLGQRSSAWYRQGDDDWTLYEPIAQSGPVELRPFVTAASYPYPARAGLPRRWWERRREILTPTVPVKLNTWHPPHTPPGVCDPPDA